MEEILISDAVIYNKKKNNINLIVHTLNLNVKRGTVTVPLFSRKSRTIFHSV